VAEFFAVGFCVVFWCVVWCGGGMSDGHIARVLNSLTPTMSVPSVKLNIDGLFDGDRGNPEVDTPGGDGESMVKRATQPGVDSERCVVPQYKTSTAQLDAFNDLLKNSDPNYIPLEWVIDIADESNGWFYGTAYHYNNSTNMLHVMVPDKLNPSFDGEIPLDHRTVHLVECVDGKTEALFNKIVRDSVVKVRWEVQWFEEGAGTEKQMPDVENGMEGRWVLSIARYYIQMANQVLVEDQDFGQDSRGFVMLTADMNLRLRTCYKGKGFEDFSRLVSENIVQSTPNAIESSQKTMGVAAEGADGMGFDRQVSQGGPSGNIRKLAEMSRGLRECVSDILDDRERLVAENEKTSRAFHSFVLEGDLEAGLKLMTHSELTIQCSDKTPDVHKSKKAQEKEAHQELMDSAAEDVWYLCQRVEKSSFKLLKSQGEGLGAGAGGVDELDYLRRTKAKMQREIEERDRELEQLRARVR
jgi:hypothetical protein